VDIAAKYGKAVYVITEEEELTNPTLRPQIRARHHPHTQVVLHFADDFYRVVELEV
jgi:hypothetical protein